MGCAAEFGLRGGSLGLRLVDRLDQRCRVHTGWSNRWKAALNAFEITFDGRLSAGRK